MYKKEEEDEVGRVRIWRMKLNMKKKEIEIPVNCLFYEEE
jgi:hypothetical protein